MTIPSDYVQRHILRHTYALIAWAILNLTVGGVGMFFSAGLLHHFLHMNAAWGSVNLVVGLILWYSTTQTTTPGSALSRSRQFRKVLLINIFLDSTYLMAGLWLLKKGTLAGEYAAYFTGFGYSVLLQGAVLLLFDLLSIHLLHRHKNVRSQERQVAEAG
ncbi:DUF6992 family protein [Telluribacter sp. SYSU D00476]|uniref:DUF6992 family protein n=1 Tax=Telluribacter sp. SYSU D00476 TaxID=2811430 RepID=UPI001FF5DB2D|nr:hypothetical protein [Telluribacter sp. SYSU D00476]